MGRLGIGNEKLILKYFRVTVQLKYTSFQIFTSDIEKISIKKPFFDRNDDTSDGYTSNEQTLEYLCKHKHN